MKKAILYMLLLFCVTARGQYQPLGSYTSNGTNAWVLATCVYGGNLYVGGQFSQVYNSGGPVAASCVAMWNGTTWSALGAGITGWVNNGSNPPQVQAMVVWNNMLVVGGQFTTAGGITTYGLAAWDGANWHAIPAGSPGIESWGWNSGCGCGMVMPSGEVYALATDGTNLYVSGTFGYADGVATNDVAMYNGTSWNYAGNNGGTGFALTGTIEALAYSGGILYAAGQSSVYNSSFNQQYVFQSVGGTGPWSVVGSGMCNTCFSSTVQGLCIWNGELVATGFFCEVNGCVTPANYIAAWNGFTWSPIGSPTALGTGINDGMSVYGYSPCGAGSQHLYVGGQIANNSMEWNGASWGQIGTGSPNGVISSMTSYTYGAKTYLVMGGSFNSVGSGACCNFTANNVVLYDCTVLPINLISFTAECNTTGALLQWQTATETNNNHFTVERSSDGERYEALEIIKGSGTSSTTRNYSTIDNNPLPGVSYYRLSQTDDDGTTVIVSTASYTQCENSNTINAFGNTSKGVTLEINSAINDAYTINITNTLGQVLFTTTRNVAKGANSFDLNPNVSSGIYIIQVIGKEKTFTKKLLLGTLMSN